MFNIPSLTEATEHLCDSMATPRDCIAHLTFEDSYPFPSHFQTYSSTTVCGQDVNNRLKERVTRPNMYNGNVRACVGR